MKIESSSPNLWRTTRDILDSWELELLPRLKALIADSKTKKEDFNKALTQEQLLILGTFGLAEEIAEPPPKYANEVIKLRALLKQDIPEIRAHKGFRLAVEQVVKKFQSIVETKMPVGKDGVPLHWARVSRAIITPMLIGSGSELEPWMRIALIENSDEPSIDTMANAGDITFLAICFSGALLDFVKYCQPLVEKGIIQLPDKEPIVAAIEVLSKQIEEVKSIAAQLGIGLEKKETTK